MKNRRLIILVAVGCIAALSVIRGIMNFSKDTRSKPDASLGSAPTTSKNAPINLPEGTEMARTKYSSWGRNPFAAVEAGSRSEASGLSLSGIAWEANRPQAVINGRIVGVGDEVAGSRVVEINQDSVVLSDGSNRFVLKLWRKQ